MGFDRSRNAGITGLMDIQGTPKFWARIYRFSRQSSAGPIVRTKRGDVWRRVRQTTPGGTLAIAGKARLDGYPEPDSLKGAAGTITLQYSGAAKITLSVVVTEATISFNETKEDQWDIALVCEVTANPTLAGFGGTQASNDPPSYDVAETHEGASKTVDPDTIADADTRRFDIDGLGDTDAAEVTAITNLIGQSTGLPPRSAMKVRSALFQRTDHWGGTVVVSFQRTTTGEDIINERSQTSIDPQGLASTASTAAINGAAPTPSGDAFVLRNTTSNEINDLNALKVATFGKRSTKQDIEFPGSITAPDITSLEDRADITQVTKSSTPPATPDAPLGQIVSSESEQLTDDGYWRHHWVYANTNSQQKVEFGESDTGDDPSDLQDDDAVCIVNDSSTPPATPTPSPSDLVLRRRQSRRISGTPERWRHRFEFGRRTTQEDIEFPGTVTTAEQTDLEDAASITRVTGMSSPPSTPAAPLGQILAITSEQLTHSGKWKHSFTYGNTTAQQKIEFAGTQTEVDPTILIDEDRQTIVNGSSTPPATPTPSPSDLVLRRRVSRRIGGTPEKWSHAFEFARRTSQDDIENDNSHTIADPNGIEAAGHITRVTDSETPPATPTAPADTVYVTVLTRKIHASRWRHTFLYGPRTTADDAILPHTWTLADPSDLESEGEVAAFDSAPATPAGYYDRGVTGHWITSLGKILYVKKFGRTSTRQDIEFSHSESEGTPYEGLKTRAASVISNGLPIDVIASAYTTNAANFDYVSVKRLNDDKALLITGIKDNPRIINVEMRSPGEELVRGYTDGTDVWVYVRQIFQAANYWVYELAMQPLQVLRMRFSIRKRITGFIPLFRTLVGKANNAAFLDAQLFTGSVAYRGIDGFYNLSMGGPGEISYQCEWFVVSDGSSSYSGHVNFGKANLGWHRTTHNLSAISPGTWVKASTLYELGVALDSAALPVADFSGLAA
jgi:hypothetical protein